MKSHPFMIHASYFMDILDGFNAKNNELHFMDEIKYTLYFLDELLFDILRFHEYSRMDFWKFH
jgi:hypothetical protein